MVAILLYVGALRNGFAYDDIPAIRDNDLVRNGTALTRAFAFPYWRAGALYRPVTTFTFALDWAIGHGSPVLFHLVNVLWFAACASLVARLALRWWPPSSAAAAGTLFAVHPVHVEAVANIVGRSELLAGAALLGVALIVTAQGRASPAKLLAVACLTAIAYGSKETGAFAPVIAWAGSQTVSGQCDKRGGAVRRFAIASLLGLAVIVALRLNVLGTLAGDSQHVAFLASSPMQALKLALATLPRAVGLVLVPQIPRPDYSPTSAEVGHPAVVLVTLGVALVTGMLVVIVLHIRRPTPTSFALLFSAATFAPVSNLLLHTGVVLAERTLYSPSVGVCLLGGAAVAPLWATRRERWLGLGLLAGLALLASNGAVYALESVSIWRDTKSVTDAIAERAPTSYRGYFARAKALQDQGRIAEAHVVYQRGIALFAGDPGMLYDAGINAAAAGDTSAAVEWLKVVVTEMPTFIPARSALVALDLRRGDTSAARSLVRAGLAIDAQRLHWRLLYDSLTGESRSHR